MRCALEFREVSYAYDGHPAVAALSFTIAPGEILCLLGPSGCGKTTALRLAAGLEHPDAGEVIVADRIAADATVSVPPEQRGVGLLFQDYALFPHLTVERNVTFGLSALEPDERFARAREWLERVGLADRAGDYPHRLSGGEQQRVALARAMAPRPAVLLLDEPFSNLDSQLRQQVREQVHDALKAVGTAALMVTHSREEALYMGDRIALMQTGSILQTGDALSLYREPVSLDAARFFGDVNVIEGTVSDGQAHTPIGVFTARGVADGSRKRCGIRAEAVGVVPVAQAPDRPVAVVTGVRRLGRFSRVNLRVTDDDGKPVDFVAESTGMVAFDAGERVAIVVDAADLLQL